MQYLADPDGLFSVFQLRQESYADVAHPGGLDLRKVDPRTMRVNGIEGLQVFGELLDLDGPIGGLNFQAAFACAELAGGFLAND